jgi:hypothetical protein
MSDVSVQSSAYGFSQLYVVLILDGDRTRLPRPYRNAEYPMVLAILLTVRRLHPDVFLTPRLIPRQSDDQWHARAIVVEISSQQNSTFRRLPLLRLAGSQ